MSDASGKLFRSLRSISLFSFAGLLLLITLLGMHKAGPGIGNEVHGVCGGGIPPMANCIVKRPYHDVTKILGREFDEIRGEKLFYENCTSCHALNERITGPALSGIAERLPQLTLPWMKKLLSASKEATRGRYYQSLIKEYNDMRVHERMTFSLSESEISDLSGYLLMY